MCLEELGAIAVATACNCSDSAPSHYLSWPQASTTQIKERKHNWLGIKPVLVVFHRIPKQSDRDLHRGLSGEREFWNSHIHINYDHFWDLVFLYVVSPFSPIDFNSSPWFSASTQCHSSLGGLGEGTSLLQVTFMNPEAEERSLWLLGREEES